MTNATAVLLMIGVIALSSAGTYTAWALGGGANLNFKPFATTTVVSNATSLVTAPQSVTTVTLDKNISGRPSTVTETTTANGSNVTLIDSVGFTITSTQVSSITNTITTQETTTTTVVSQTTVVSVDVSPTTVTTTETSNSTRTITVAKTTITQTVTVTTTS
ncbi:MAG: hypothetical protein ACYC7D_00130 [Nitrososphaerales archaeon]